MNIYIIYVYTEDTPCKVQAEEEILMNLNVNTDFEEEMELDKIDVQAADDIALLTSGICASSTQKKN